MRTCLTRPVTLALLAGGMIFSAARVKADHGPRLNELLSRGQLAAAETEFAQAATQQNDQQARMSLGIVQFLQAVENLARGQYRFGLLQEFAQQIPILRLPVPPNPHPEQAAYSDLQNLLTAFARQLERAEKTLGQVDTQDVKLTLLLGRVRLDIDGDGTASDAESFWKIFTTINRGLQAEHAEEFALGLDGADVHWLRGYCHLLMAFCDMALAYDGREWFETCGHLLYPRIDTPYEFLQQETRSGQFDSRRIADLIAAIHLLNFPLKDADKLRSAHQHLLAMIVQSRHCWERALAETDDDREWIPNPQQTSVIGLRVAREQIDGWHAVLDEFGAVLEGKKLIPFWRKYGGLPLFGFQLGPVDVIPDIGTGINAKRFFTEPRDLDLILFLTGTGAVPYLEEGPLSTPETWQRITRVFQGEFFGFAIWFN
ncbi:MAG: hypothetical protein KF861_02995 [Planctomycetaceae bacterium]|nr:hypothetical protein [Planctomycetaceae bacterium]